MKVRELHPWNVSTSEAMEIQRRLASQISRHSSVPAQVRHVAGLDISVPRDRRPARAAAVVLAYPSLDVVEVRTAESEPPFPYVPGLLSFREVPVLLGVLKAVETTPDIVMVDGQGIAHPRRFGLACHLGLMLDVPTIGCAKSILVGTHGPLPEEAAARTWLEDDDDVVGAAVRTRKGVKPVYVSVGHRISLEAAIGWTLACCRGLRIPEPTRQAHQAAGGHLPPKEPDTGTRKQGRIL